MSNLFICTFVVFQLKANLVKEIREQLKFQTNRSNTWPELII